MTKQCTIDAFSGKITDYTKAMNDFGIRPFAEIVESIDEKLLHTYIRRGIMFGHTDAKKVFRTIQDRKPFAVMTGIKPTGKYHIGSLITCKEVLYFQSLGAKVFFCIADMESYLHNGLPLDQAHQKALDNVADILALGLAQKGLYIYKQSEEPRVLRLAAQFAKDVTYNTMKAIYGKQKFGIYQSALIQIADIFLPQLEEFGGPLPTITPVGFEQAPHSRLARDIARKKIYQEEFGFHLPAFTFHQIIGSLDGGEKMSKSAGSTSLLTLSETKSSLKTKIARIFTGGRDTKKEQLELGGQPEICRVFDLLRFFFIENDAELAKRFQTCMEGNILCGECKKDLQCRILHFITKHQERKEGMIDYAKQILEL